MMGPELACHDDHYLILGVSSSASEAALKIAYRSLIKKHHPDLGVSASSDELARRINEAYQTLRDPVARERYDLERQKGLTSQIAITSRPRPSSAWSIARQEETYLRRSARASTATSLILIGFILCGAGLTSSFIVSDVFDETVESGLVGLDRNIKKNNSNASAHAAPPPPRMDDIETGAFEFLDIYQKMGMSGARNFSIRCHEQVRRAPSWRELDECASFDYAAAYVDGERSRKFGHTTDPYFVREREHQERNYLVGGADPYTIFSRLKKLEWTIEYKIAEASAPAIAPAR